MVHSKRAHLYMTWRSAKKAGKPDSRLAIPAPQQHAQHARSICSPTALVLLYARIGSDRGVPKSTIMCSTESGHVVLGFQVANEKRRKEKKRKEKKRKEKKRKGEKRCWNIASLS